MAGLKTPNGPYCRGCILERSGRGFMKVDGKGHSGVMLVGEALGYNEAQTGQPFVGPAGIMLRKVLKRHVKLERNDFWIANSIFCRPPGNNLQGTSYKYAAINHCRQHLNDAIEKLQPRAIVALGDIAMERLIPGRTGIIKAQNYAYRGEHGIWVVPALHPAFIMRGNNKYQPILGHAINKAVRIAKEGYEHAVPSTIQQPSAGEFESWIAGYEAACVGVDESPPLAFDIETNYKGARDESKLKEGDDPTYEILQISFAYGPSEGISLEWNASYKPLIQRLLGAKGPKIVWNRSYDVPRLLYHGIRFGGPIRDSMIAWHALQSDLDKGLGFVTPLIPANHQIPQWKDTSADEGGWFYAAMDSVMLWRNDHHIMNTLKAQGVYPFFNKYVEEVRPVLDDMENAGVLVDKEIQKTFIDDCETQLASLEEQMNDIVPEKLRDLDPKEGYKRTPEDTTGMRQLVVKGQEWMECPVCHLKNPTKPHFKTYVAKRSLHKNTICSGMEAVPMKGDERRWAKVKPFKPSPVQLLRYAVEKKYSPRKNWKTGNVTFDEETIVKLQKKHPNDPLFPLVLKHRSVQKLYGLYGPEGLLVGKDGRVHTHFSDNPSTFRFASYGPNMQNIPRGSVIRNLFVAAPRHRLGARDFSGIEAVLVGYLAADRDYTRLAKMGVHDYVNAHIAVERGLLPPSDLPDLSLPDQELASYLAELKESLKETRPIAKQVVHMSNYLGSPLRMYQSNPDLYENTAAAEHVQGLYFEMFPKVKAWQSQVVRLADRQGYIMSPYKLAQRFFQLYTYERDKETGEWVKKLGQDAKRAVAANPQHMAAAIMRRAIYDLRNSWVRSSLRLTIHDELLWECLETKMDLVDAHIKEVMEAPNLELPLDPAWNMGTHLSIGTEAKFGKAWGGMK